MKQFYDKHFTKLLYETLLAIDCSYLHETLL